MTRKFTATAALPRLTLTAITLALALSGCGKSQAPGMGGMPGGGGPTEVGIVVLQPETMTVSAELSGRTVANVIAEIRPQVGGVILQRLFHEGGEVKAGELLYQIDPAMYQANLDSASATLAKAEANVATVRLKAERYQELLASKAVSQQSFDDASAALKTAEADVAASKAAVAVARINLNYTRVASPISGRIGKSSITQGALVTANQGTALATVQQLDPINVDVTQSTRDMMQLKRAFDAGQIKSTGDGQAKVKLLLEDGSAYPLEGKLAFAEATVDAGTSTVTLRAVFPNPKRELLPGMYVRAVIEQGVREQSLLVPQQGVSRDPLGNATAMVVGAENKAEPRQLKAERAIGDKWLVTEGLKAGDQLIVEGLQKVRPGAPVKPVPAGSPSAAPGGAPGAPGAAPAAAAGKAGAKPSDKPAEQSPADKK